MAGQTPEVRSIVDIKRCASAILARQPQRLEHCLLGLLVAEMRSGGDDRAAGGDIGRIDIVLGQTHIGAVFAIEDQREPMFVADAEKDERGQTLRVGFHAPDVHAFALKLLKDESPHMLVADAGDETGPQANVMAVVAGRNAGPFTTGSAGAAKQ